MSAELSANFPNRFVEGLRKGVDTLHNFLRSWLVSQTGPTRLDPIDEEVIALYSGWDELESRLAGSGKKIDTIDSDCTGISGIQPWVLSSRKEAIDAFEKESKKVALRADEVQDLDPGSSLVEQLRILSSQLDATAMYLLIKTGRRLNFNYYVEGTMGKPAEHIDQREINSRFETLKELFNQMGYGGNLVEAALKFRERRRLNPDQVKDQMVGVVENRLLMVVGYIGLPTPDMRVFSPEQFMTFEHHPTEWWRMDTVYRGEKPQVTINTAAEYYAGDPEYFGQHEIWVHSMHQVLLRHRISGKKVIPSLGIRVLHGPTCHTSEGLAQTIKDFLPKMVHNTSQEGEASYLTQVTARMILSNALLIANELGDKNKKLLEAEKYARGMLPFISPREIRRFLMKGAEDPSQGAYMWIYGPSAVDFNRISRSLGNLENRGIFLRDDYYGYPLTAQGVQTAVDRIIRAT